MSLLTQLTRLESDGLIQVAATYPELEYLFRHGLIKDAAYFSLLKGDRRVLHQAVGEALERPYGPPSADHPLPRDLLPALAHHFGEAGDAARALLYSTLAGDAAAGTYANAEAILHYTHALDWAGSTPVSGDQLKHLHLNRGRAQELGGHYADALADYTALEAAGRARGEPALELAGLIQRVVVHAVPSPNVNVDIAMRLADQALPLARQLGDRAAEARLAWAKMLAFNGGGDVVAAIRAGERALALARALAEPELLATTLGDISRLYLGIGAPDRAAAVLAEAQQLWRGLHNVPMLAETLTTTGGLAFFRGHYDAALAHLDEGLRLSQSIANAWGTAYNLMYRSYVLVDRGDLSAAVDAMQRCLYFAALGGFVYPQAGINAALALAYTYLGEDAAAEAALGLARQAAAQYVPFEMVTVFLFAAWRRLLQGDHAGAADEVRQARATFRPDDHLTANHFVLALVESELSLRQGAPEQALARIADFFHEERGRGNQAFTSDLLRLHGEVLLALGRHAEAEQVLLDAHAQAAAQPSYRTLWTISAALARLAAVRGDATGVERWRGERDRHRDYLAAHIDDPDQRAAFLAAAERRAPIPA